MRRSVCVIATVCSYIDSSATRKQAGSGSSQDR